MIKVKIDGTEYENVAYIESSVTYDYHHDVQTMDGRRHRDVKGKRKNYTITFYNDLKTYDGLKRKLENVESVVLTVPDGAEKSQTGEYFVTIEGDEIKGLLYDGKYYLTALQVTFEKVDYDE